MNAEQFLKVVPGSAFERPRCEAVPPETLRDAAHLIEQVREGGDEALRGLASRFDRLPEESPLRIDHAQLLQAADSIPAAQRELLSRTADRIRAFAEAQRACLVDLELTQSGLRMGHRVGPVPAAGCYAPGGRYPLPSSVLMTAVTARVAGVDQVIVASPNPDPVILAAAGIAGASALIPVGGAHAIAAMCLGTGEVPRCDVVVGPGNAWVTAAKQILAGQTRIDSLAGPSELLVVIDSSSDAALVAADLLAQAEHDPGAVPAVIALDGTALGRVEDELSLQLRDLPTAETARTALHNGIATIAPTAEAAVDLCNRFAPEHLQWMAADRSVIAELRHYGGLFVGEGAAEVLADYGAGPNHVLPTGGSARSRGGLSVLDFLKIQTWMEGDAAPALAGVTRDAARMAEMEGLDAHARAARRRLADA